MDAKNLHFCPFRPIVPNSTISLRAILLSRSHSSFICAGYLRVSSNFQHAPGVASAAPALDMIQHSLILFYTLLPILSIAHVAFATLL
jgi:hypothetical protein